GAIAPGGVIPPVRPYSSPAAKAESAKEPKLKATLRIGSRRGVTEFTSACARLTQTAAPVPYSTYAAMTAAKDTEIALERNRNTGTRFARHARPTRHES